MACEETLNGAVKALFEGEKAPVVAAVAWALARVLEEGRVSARELRARPEGEDALLLMDEWRLLQLVGGSATKAWEDTSQLLAMGRDFDLDFPAWIRALVRRACDTERLQVRQALLAFFAGEGHPAWSKLPAFLFEMARASQNGIIDAARINRLLRAAPLGIPADTLIAQMKSYGCISPHLRADFFRMQTPRYEIHPLLVHAATREGDPPGVAS